MHIGICKEQIGKLWTQVALNISRTIILSSVHKYKISRLYTGCFSEEHCG